MFCPRFHGPLRRLVSRPRDSRHNCRAGHPRWRRCSSFKYAEYSHSSRLASGAPRSGIYATYHAAGTLACALAIGTGVVAQSTIEPANSAPNPYQTIEGWAKMPTGRSWGSTSAVDIDKDGKSIWVAERCGANSCWDAAKGTMSTLDVVLKFDAVGQARAQLRRRPDGLPARHSRRPRRQRLGDRRPGQPAAPRPRRRARCAAAAAAARSSGIRFSSSAPTASCCSRSARPAAISLAQPADPASFYQPNDVITNDRRRDLRRRGASAKRPRTRESASSIGPASSSKPGARTAALPASSTSRTRSRSTRRAGCSSRIDRTTASRFSIRTATLLDHGWEQYSRISGIWIDKNDMLYAADSESGSVAAARRPGSAASGSAASAMGSRARFATSSRIPRRSRQAPVPPKVSPSTRPATFMAPRSDHGR